MKLIVGLGNPGKEYENTRHNVGFYMLDEYVKNKKFGIWKEKFNGLYLDVNVGKIKVIFLKPLSYMNLSGTVVKKYMDFYKIDVSDILIISDDLDLNIGNFKLKEKGSSGGHNGLKNIQENIKTDQYKRIKIGISNNKSIDTKDYVLSRFNSNDLETFKLLSVKINKVLDDYFEKNFSTLMNLYNKKNR